MPLVLAGLSALALVPLAAAAPPVPSPGVADVDGDPAEWSSADRFADLTIDGRADGAVLGHLSLRYDCETETLFGLVLLTTGEVVKVDRPEEAYLRIGTSGKLVSGLSGDDGTPPDFAWVPGAGDDVVGFEADAPLAPGTYSIRAHLLIPDESADGYATVDSVSRVTPLEIVCTAPSPSSATPSPTPTPSETTPTPSQATPTPSQATPTPSPATPTPSQPTPTPTGSEGPVGSVPSSSPTGQVGGVVGTPRITLPPTDVAGELAPTRLGTGWGIALLVSGAAILAAVAFRPRRAGR